MTHLDATEIAAYLDRRAPDADVRRIEAHLSTCDSCRSEVAGVFRTVDSIASRRRGRWRISTALAAVLAAVIGVQVIFYARPDVSAVQGPGTPSAAAFRGPQAPAEAESIPRLVVHHPEDRRALPIDSVLFIWEARAADAVYRFTLTDDAGDVLWRTTTTDTLLVPDAAIPLAPDRSYFWIVDALYEGGRSATTGARSFRVRRE